MFTILQHSSPLPPDPLLASIMKSPLDFKEESTFRQLLLSILDDFPPIDKLMDFNYTTWARDCAEGLVKVSCGQFINGSTVKPTDPVDLYRWTEQDLYVAKLILSHVSDSERMRVEQQCRGYTSSSDLWNRMRRLYLHPDTIANSKAIYFRRALGHIFPADGLFGPTLEAMRADIERLYSIGAPTADDLLYAVLLRALSAHHPNIQSALQISGTIDPFVICQRLEGIDLLRRFETSLGSSSSNTTAAVAVPAKPIRAACLHCNRSNHSSDKCWQKFGKPEWLRIKERGRKAAPVPSNRSSLSTPSVQANTAVVVEFCGTALDNSINSPYAL